MIAFVHGKPVDNSVQYNFEVGGEGQPLILQIAIVGVASDVEPMISTTVHSVSIETAEIGGTTGWPLN